MNLQRTFRTLLLIPTVFIFASQAFASFVFQIISSESYKAVYRGESQHQYCPTGTAINFRDRISDRVAPQLTFGQSSLQTDLKAPNLMTTLPRGSAAFAQSTLT